MLKELILTLEKPLPAGKGVRLCLPKGTFGVGRTGWIPWLPAQRAVEPPSVLSCQTLGSPLCNLELRLAT